MRKSKELSAEAAFFDALHEAILIFDPRGQICSANKLWRDDILQGREKSPAHIRQTFSEDAIQHIENAMKNLGDQTFITLGHIDVVVDHLRVGRFPMTLRRNADRTFYFISVANDEDVNLHQRNLNALVQSLDDIVFEVDDEGVYRNVWVADDAHVFFRKENFLMKRMSDLLPYAMANRLTRSLKKSIETDAPIIEEVPSPNDPNVWFRYRFAPINFDNSSRKTVAMSIQNITDLKRAQSRLQQSEELHRLVVTATKDAIWDWNLITNDVTVNRRWEEIVGTAGSRPHLVGTRHLRYEEIARAIFHDDRRNFEVLMRSQKDATETGVTLRLHGKDGKTIWVLCRGACIRDEDDKPIRWIGAFTDITDMDSFETSKLITLGEIADGVAHEINNPLALILGQTELIRRSLPDDLQNLNKFNRSLNYIKEGAQRIAKIVHTLETFARDGSHDPLKNIATDNLIDDVKALVLEKIKNLSINFAVKNEFKGTFEGKETQLLQVINNILQNSIDAVTQISTERKISLTITSVDQQVVFSIENNGQPLPDEIKQNLANPHIRTSTSKIGLGLASAVGIIKKSGGSLDLVVSEPGKTIYRIALPISSRALLNAA